MQGHFEIGAYHTPGLTEETLLDALGPVAQREDGSVLDFLSQYEKTQEVKGHNLVQEIFAGCVFAALFGDAGGVPNAYGRNEEGGVFGLINLSNRDAEPSYTGEREGDSYYPFNSVSYSVGSGASKRFINDDVEPYLISEASDGQEAVTLRHRWLYLPSQAVSSVIRSLTVWFMDTPTDTGSNYSAPVCRIRLKDSAGNPIVINKTADITLFVEYRFTLITV